MKMTMDELKELLRQYREICGYIYDLSAEQQLICTIDSEKTEPIKKNIDAEIENMCAMRDKIEKSVENVDDITQKRVLYLKYLRGMTNEKIAVRCGYSERQIARILSKGLISAIKKTAL